MGDQKRVRIAILDTGVDTIHPQIRAAREANRIVAYFPESSVRALDSDSKPPDPFQDHHGHGTHGTSVLLQTAPNAAIYIAKVTDNDGNLIYDDIVKVHLFLDR
jgi:subtilisin family serine protease